MTTIETGRANARQFIGRMYHANLNLTSPQLGSMKMGINTCISPIFCLNYSFSVLNNQIDQENQ